MAAGDLPGVVARPIIDGVPLLEPESEGITMESHDGFPLPYHPNPGHQRIRKIRIGDEVEVRIQRGHLERDDNLDPAVHVKVTDVQDGDLGQLVAGPVVAVFTGGVEQGKGSPAYERVMSASQPIYFLRNRIFRIKGEEPAPGPTETLHP